MPCIVTAMLPCWVLTIPFKHVSDHLEKPVSRPSTS